MGLLNDRRIARILRGQGFRRERSASREVGQMAVEERMATQAQVDECLALQEARFRETKKMASLADLLFEKGAIDKSAQRTLLRAQRRMEKGQSDRHTTIAYGVKECANCFETVHVDATRCPHCGNGFGEIDLAIPCPKCSAPQTDGSEFCAKCGANLVTGEAPSRPVAMAGRCPGCGRIMSPDQRICFQCGYLRPRPLAQRVTRAVGGLVGYVWSAGKPLIALLVLAVLVIVSIRFWPRLRQTSTDLAFGESESRLRKRVEEVRKALLYQDALRIRRMMVVDPSMADGPMLSWIAGAGGVQVEVVDCRIAEVLPGDDEGSAYVDIDLKCAEEPPQHDKTGNPWGDLEAAIGMALSKGKQFTKRLTWRFKRVGDEWKLEAP
jgi:RNA polymerase subunit RPABC4/transcription elongation factor Spt4